MKRVDLNCDLGESFGNYKCGLDADVIPHISSANVACGFHASDPLVMMKTVALAKQHDVAVGAHPGYPDLVGFGRRNMSVSVDELKAMVQYQIGALKAFCDVQGMTLQHVKPHGALYNMAAKDEKIAKAICLGIYDVSPKLILMGLAGSEMLRQAELLGLPAASEVFADRAYEDDGTLVARSKPGAMIEDEDLAVERVIRMIRENKVESISGKEITIRPDSVCVHGDSEKALLFVKKIRNALERENISVCDLKTVLSQHGAL